MDRERIKKQVEIIKDLRRRLQIEEAKFANYIRAKLRSSIHHTNPPTTTQDKMDK